MSDAFRFETFVDVHSNIFNECIGSVIAKLSRENEEYRAVRAEIENLYEKYPKVLGVFDILFVGQRIEGDANSELFFRPLSH